jgi:hypothetical protein
MDTSFGPPWESQRCDVTLGRHLLSESLLDGRRGHPIEAERLKLRDEHEW